MALEPCFHQGLAVWQLQQCARRRVSPTFVSLSHCKRSSLLHMTLAHALSDEALCQLNSHIESSYTREQLYLDWSSYYRQDEQALMGFAQFYQRLALLKRQDATKMVQHIQERDGIVAQLSVSCPAQSKQRLSVAALLLKAIQLEHDSFIRLSHDAEAFENDDPVYEHFIEEEFLSPRIFLLDYLKQLSTMTARVTRPEPATCQQTQEPSNALGLYELDKMLLRKSNDIFDALEKGQSVF